MPKTVTPEQLEQEAREAQAKADELRARLEKERAAEEQRRQQRLRVYDEHTLREYDDAALEADVLAAEQRLREAIEADPVFAALVDVETARTVRRLRWADARSTAARVHGHGADHQYVEPPSPGGVNLDTAIGRVISQAASARAQANEAARAEARQRIAQGEA